MNTSERASGVSTPLLALIAVTSGFGVAAIYYAQPVLAVLAHDFNVSASQIGLVPVMTQLGYGIGIVFLVPLGDLLERKTLILWLMGLLALVLAVTSMVTSLVALCAASFAVGLLGTVAQQMVAFAAQIATEENRGKVIGTVMMGLLLGILLSRTVSGAMAEWLGWRAVFRVAAAVAVILGLLLASGLKRSPPAAQIGYLQLMGSLATLFKKHRTLRRAVFVQMFLSSGFFAFWSVLALMLARPPFEMGPGVAGLLGLVGAAGALSAPLAGRFSDKNDPSKLVLIGCILVTVSFAGMGIWQGSMPVLIAGALFMDVGMQTALIANQTRIYALDPAARGRLTGILVGSMFAGAAIGSALASYVFAHAGWGGVCAQATITAMIGLGFELVFRRGDRIAAAPEVPVS